MFSDKFYRDLPFPPSNTPRNNLIPVATRDKQTILFLHGNTGTRALSLRTVLYTAYTSRLNSNVLAIDYRGFGDSEGLPTEAGVAVDARTGWDYLIKQGARAEDILIMGHSLGTAVASLLAAQLGRENVVPRGLVLMSVRMQILLGVVLSKTVYRLTALHVRSNTHRRILSFRVPSVVETLEIDTPGIWFVFSFLCRVRMNGADLH
jgi:pimeloyl-ACP methyl ester carboxylesterase